jgi:hypothetical protein
MELAEQRHRHNLETARLHANIVWTERSQILEAVLAVLLLFGGLAVLWKSNNFWAAAIGGLVILAEVAALAFYFVRARGGRLKRPRQVSPAPRPQMSSVSRE